MRRRRGQPVKVAVHIAKYRFLGFDPVRGEGHGRKAMSFARVAASAAILTILSIGCALAKPATVSADVNLRKAAGTDSEVLTLIPKGSKVEVGKCTNGWCQVTWNSQDGYAIARNLGLGGTRVAGGYRRMYPPGEGGDDGYGPPMYGPGPGYGPPPPYYGYGPYGYGPYYGPYGGPGWGWRGGWRRW
jgi:uncharacterized protein YraI